MKHIYLTVFKIIFYNNSVQNCISLHEIKLIKTNKPGCEVSVRSSRTTAHPIRWRLLRHKRHCWRHRCSNPATRDGRFGPVLFGRGDFCRAWRISGHGLPRTNSKICWDKIFNFWYKKSCYNCTYKYIYLISSMTCWVRQK